jgi:hypothetical protein
MRERQLVMHLWALSHAFWVVGCTGRALEVNYNIKPLVVINLGRGKGIGQQNCTLTTAGNILEVG